MIVNFDSYINLKMNLAKGFAVIAIKVLIALLCLLVASCGQPLEAINDRGGEIIENVTEKGVEVNKHVDEVTGTLGSEAGKAARVSQRTLNEIRTQAANNPEYEQVINDNEALLEEICAQNDPDIITKEEYENICF